jgi:septum formation protein
MKMTKLILASKSPRRQSLLKTLGYDFDIQTKDVPEDYPDSLPIFEVPAYLAEKKALPFIDEMLQGEVLITADTIVIFEGKVLGKPQDLMEAKEMLQMLSGKTHEVISGVCILSKNQKKIFSDLTKVYFKNLTEEEINFYLQNQPPLDKAGAYGIQDWIGMIGVERIEGCFYNVMGLPVSKLYQALKDFES